MSWNPSGVAAWIRFAELESSLGDEERARGIFEIAVGQEALDMPEVLWKGYIDFETREEEWERARALYERLLQRTEHVKVKFVLFTNMPVIFCIMRSVFCDLLHVYFCFLAHIVILFEHF